MRAVGLDEAGQPALGEVPEPDGSGETVDVVVCGLCGTDVQKLGRAAAGTVLGHEVVAKVETDDESRSSTICPAASATAAGPGTRPPVRGSRSRRSFRAASRSARALQKTIALPDEIDDATGTFAEPLACVLRAVERIPRGRVLVVGYGFAGLLFTQALVRRGDDVFASDPLTHRLELALGYGVQPADGEPVDAAVLCPHAGLDGALAALEPGGTLLLFSWLVDPAAVDFEAVLRRELTLIGSCSATPAAMREAIALLPELDPIPTVTLPPSASPRASTSTAATRPPRSSSRRGERSSTTGPCDLRVEEVPRPEPGPGDVLVQVEVALTDGTDAKASVAGTPCCSRSYRAPSGTSSAASTSPRGAAWSRPLGSVRRLCTPWREETLARTSSRS